MIKIAIASGKGGTGKTFVATNIFYSLLKSNIDSVIVDCDAEAPDDTAFFNTEQKDSYEVTQLNPVIDIDKCTFCGACRDYCNYQAIFILPPVKIINVIEDLCHGCGACSVACREGAISEKHVTLGTVSYFSCNGSSLLIEAKTRIGLMSPVPVIKSAIRNIPVDTEIAVLDSPPGTSCPFIQTVSAADYVILVTEPTPFGLSDLKQSAETLKNMGKNFGVIINRSGLGNNDVYSWLFENGISLLMEIPFDERIARLYSEGRLLAAEDAIYFEKFFGIAQELLAVIKK